MDKLVTWIGWDTQTLMGFWSSPLGLLCTFLLTATSAYRVLHKESRVGLFDTLWHLAMALTCASAFLTGWHDNPPQNIVRILVILMTVRGVYKCICLGKSKHG